MDADSTITPDFLEVALGLLEEDQDLIAVGGLFYGEEGGGLIGQLQRNEYTRYQRIVARKLNRVFVLTGTASVIRSYALRAVSDAREMLIPGTRGQVYDTLALTEDNELTLALKTLGAQMTSPPQCRVTTEVMTRWRDLWRQRLRWHRGALENIGAYGPTRATAMYWTQQTALAYGVVALWSYLLLMTITLLAADSVRVVAVLGHDRRHLRGRARRHCLGRGVAGATSGRPRSCCPPESPSRQVEDPPGVAQPPKACVAVAPPSTASSAPVTKLDSSLAR